MSVLGIDNFIRSDQSNWGAASDGQTWTKTGSGTLSIVSNKGKMISNDSDTHVQLGSAVAGDVEASCRIIIGNSNDVCGVQGRFTASGGTTTYKLVWYGGAIHLNKAVAGNTTQMTSVSFAMTPGAAYWFRLRVVKESGTNLFGKIWQDGLTEPPEWATTASDAAVTGPGGFAVLGSTNASSTGILFDNFMAVDSPTAEASATIDEANITSVITITDIDASIETLSVAQILSIVDVDASSDSVSTRLLTISLSKPFVLAAVKRNDQQIYPSLVFRIERMSEVEAMSHSAPPYFLYNGHIWGIYDLRQNDYIEDLNTVDLVGQAKAYQIINEPETFHAHTEFQCMRADRAALTRSS